MAEPAFTDDVEEEVRRVIEAFEPAFSRIDPAYPVGCCVGACMALAGFLDLHLDESGVWAPPVERWLGGRRYEDDAHAGDHHQWLVMGGVIVDPTAGQFYPAVRPALRIYRPGEPSVALYDPLEQLA